MTPDDDNPFSDSYDPIAHGVDPMSEEWLRNRQLMAAMGAGAGFIVRDLETGEIAEIIEPTVSPETKAGAGESGLN